MKCSDIDFNLQMTLFRLISARLDCVQAVVEVIPAGVHHDDCLDCKLTATLRNSLQVYKLVVKEKGLEN